MDEKLKVEPDAALSIAAGRGEQHLWNQNQQNPRAEVPTKAPQGAPQATPKFDGTYDGLKGGGLVFDSANPRVDCFTHVKREIAEYTRKDYTNGGDVWWTPERGKQKTIDPLASLATNDTDVDKKIFKVEVSEYFKRRNRLRANIDSALTFIFGYFTKLTQMHLEGLPTWEAVDDSSNMINLINIVKSLYHQITDHNYHPLSLYMAKNTVYGLYQVPHITNTQLVDKIKARVEVI